MRAAATALTAAIAAFAATADAQPAKHRDVERPWSVVIEAAPGFALFDDAGSAPEYALGLDGVFRWKMLEVGVMRDSTFEPRLPHGVRSQATGGFAGVRLFANRFRGFDALATGGLHEYEGLGTDRLAGTPGSSGALPFVGLRLGFSATLGGGPVRLVSGLWLFALTDLGRETLEVKRPDDFGPQHIEHTTLGDVEAGLTVRFGFELSPAGDDG